MECHWTLLRSIAPEPFKPVAPRRRRLRVARQGQVVSAILTNQTHQKSPRFVLKPRAKFMGLPYQDRTNSLGSVRKTVSKQLRQGDEQRDMGYEVSYGNS